MNLDSNWIIWVSCIQLCSKTNVFRYNTAENNTTAKSIAELENSDASEDEDDLKKDGSHHKWLHRLWYQVEISPKIDSLIFLTELL